MRKESKDVTPVRWVTTLHETIRKDPGASHAIRPATSLGTVHGEGKSTIQMKATKDTIWEYKVKGNCSRCQKSHIGKPCEKRSQKCYTYGGKDHLARDCPDRLMCFNC